MSDSIVVPKTQDQPDWARFLVTPGHVWHARLNSLVGHGNTAFGFGAFFFLAALLVPPIYLGGAIVLSEYVADAELMEKVESMKPKWGGVDFSSTNVKEIMRGNTEISKAEAGDLPVFVKDTLVGLNADGKLPYECHEQKDFTKPLLSDEADASELRCRWSKEKNRLWVGGIVFEQKKSFYGNRTSYEPYTGVFRKTDGKWSYYNIKAGRGQGLAVQGYPTVEPAQVAFSLQEDFPEFVAAAKKQ